MGRIYIEIWRLCILGDKGCSLRSLLHGDNRKEFIKLLVWLFIIALLMIAELCAWFFNNMSLNTILSIALIVVALAYFVENWHYERDPIMRFEKIRETNKSTVILFLKQISVSPTAIPRILDPVIEFRDERKGARRTFINRSFGLFVSGLFVVSLNSAMLTYQSGDVEIAYLLLAICALSISFAACAPLIWDIADSFHQASLTRANQMIRALESFENAPDAIIGSTLLLREKFQSLKS